MQPVDVNYILHYYKCVNVLKKTEFSVCPIPEVCSLELEHILASVFINLWLFIMLNIYN